MTIELVDVQTTFSDGTTQRNEIDCTHLEVDDFVVIGHHTVAAGGGYLFQNQFDGNPGVWYSHVAGMFGDSTDIFGHFDATMQSSGFASSFYRHTVTATDLVDTGGGQGNLSKFAWNKGAVPSPYPASLHMWTFRGATFSSKSGAGTYDTAALAASPEVLQLTGGGVLTGHQMWFSMAHAIGNGHVPPPAYTQGATDDRPTDSDFTQETIAFADWLYHVPTGTHNSSAAAVNYAYGVGLDVEETNYTVSNGGDASTSADCVFVVVTFAESFPVPPTASSRIELPQTRLHLKGLPNRLTQASLHELT